VLKLLQDLQGGIHQMRDMMKGERIGIGHVKDRICKIGANHKEV